MKATKENPIYACCPMCQNAEEQCHECAKENGHTTTEADECDDGSVGCPDCPFVVRGGSDDEFREHEYHK